MNAIIPTKVHAVLDYVGGIMIASSPWLFGFARLGGAAVFVPVLIGCLQLVMAIFSNHELGVFKVFPMQLHLVLDMFAGFILIVLPFLYGFYHLVFLPHLLLGLLSLTSGIFTQHSPLYRVDYFDGRGM